MPLSAAYRVSSILIVFAITLVAGPGLAQEKPAKSDKPAAAPDPSHNLKLPANLKAVTFAREPMLGSPVALSVAGDGTVYVTQTARRKTSNLDIRRNKDWIEHELALQSVAQKEAFLKAQLNPANSNANRKRVADYNKDGLHDWRDLAVLSERIYQLRDTDGDGLADRSTVFAEGFNTTVTGVAAGVLAHGGHVYANIAPDVWKLRDADGDGVADERTSIAQGFGVHIAYAGHNTHGLIMGPDGRLYWTTGDIGSDHLPHEGAVFRCWPDGSGFEVFCRGLRNPQEIAFDKYGNLFTGDNDSDFGDRERWLYLVEGADYGWRHHWQFQRASWGSPTGNYSMWLEEKMWHTFHKDFPAAIMPAIAHIAGGPCGITYNPESRPFGLGKHYPDHFFMAHFTGGANNSGIHAYKVQPDGAGFKLVKDELIVRNLVPTGVDIGADGSLYLADWLGGWEVHDRGRVYRVFDAGSDDAEKAELAATAKLLAKGMADRPIDELANLLGHGHMHVRREAQFELVRRGKPGFEALRTAALDDVRQLARIHGIWGLGQISQQDVSGDPRWALWLMWKLLKDDDAEIRAQALRVMKDRPLLRIEQGHSLAELATLAKSDPSERVRYFAMMALGKTRDAKALPHIVDCLASGPANGDGDKLPDPYLRYAGIAAMTWIDDEAALIGLSRHPSKTVRLATVAALRRLESSNVQIFFSDADPQVALEAARAINDVPIRQAMHELADFIRRPMSSEPFARRVLHAHRYNGRMDRLKRLVDYAADSDAIVSMRVEALEILREAPAPSARGRVTGAHRSLGLRQRLHPQELQALTGWLQSRMAQLLAGPPAVRDVALKLADQYFIELDSKQFLAWVTDAKEPASARAAALTVLVNRKDALAPKALQTALASDQPALRAQAIRFTAATDPKVAVSQIRRAADQAMSIADFAMLQAVVPILGDIDHPDAHTLLAQHLDAILRGKLHPAVQLEVIEAARASNAKAVKGSLKQWEQSLPKDDPLALHRIALQGGDAARGRDIFFYKAEAQCLRCHKAGGARDANAPIGGDTGPDLAGIGQKKSREYLLQAILQPSAAFAEGFEQTVLRTKDGRMFTGRVVRETADTLQIEVAAGGPLDDPLNDPFADNAPAAPTNTGQAATADKPILLTLPKDQIKSRTTGQSPMPAGMEQFLSDRELRDLIEYLATQ